MRRFFVALGVLALFVGCSRSQVQTYSKPPAQERAYSNVKAVAVMPMEFIGEAAAGPKNAENILFNELLALGTFERVEEPRYVSSLMKKLKLRNTESLDREIVQKIGQELQVNAIVVGSLYLFGMEEKSQDIEFSAFLNVLDVQTGTILWSGRSNIRSTTSWGQVFGLQEKASVNDMAMAGMLQLADEIDDAFVSGRVLENKLILEQMGEDEEQAKEAAPVTGEEEEPEAEELLLKVAPK